VNWSAQSPNAKLFLSVALAIPERGNLQFKLWSPARRFAPAEWTTAWEGMRTHILSRLRGERHTPGPPNDWLMEIPRFVRADPMGAGALGE